MATNAQIDANRANASLSTGPRTEAGQAISSQNARRHGLCSRQLHVPAAEREAFEEMAQSLLAEVRPSGEIQAQLFDRLIFAAWNLRAARIQLAGAQAQDDERRAGRYHRYVHQHARDYDQAYALLRREQTELALRALPPNEPILDLPAPIAASKILPVVEKMSKRDPELREVILFCLARSFHPPGPSPAEAESAPLAA